MRTLGWINEICINEADADERAAQVSLMSEIYRKATRGDCLARSVR
jgi:hypothetical protein